MSNIIVDTIEGLMLGALESKIEILKIFLVMVAVALISGTAFTEAIGLGKAVVAFVAAAGSFAMIFMILAIIAKFSDALDSLLNILK